MTKTTMIKVHLDQREKLKALAKSEDRSMISMLTILMDNYKKKK